MPDLNQKSGAIPRHQSLRVHDALIQGLVVGALCVIAGCTRTATPPKVAPAPPPPPHVTVVIPFDDIQARKDPQPITIPYAERFQFHIRFNPAETWKRGDNLHLVQVLSETDEGPVIANESTLRAPADSSGLLTSVVFNPRSMSKGQYKLVVRHEQEIIASWPCEVAE